MRRTSLPATLLLIALSAACSQDPEVARKAYMASGDKFVAEDKLSEAIIQYRNAVQKVPANGESRLKLAETYGKVGDVLTEIAQSFGEQDAVIAALARAAAPAQVLTLILSDVIGDDLSTIGSGPTAPDPTTWADVDEILSRFKLALPRLVPRVETPKPGDAIFGRVRNVIIGSNALSVDAASAKAKELGYRPLVLSTTIEGETRDVARMHVQIAKEAQRAGRPVAAPDRKSVV